MLNIVCVYKVGYVYVCIDDWMSVVFWLFDYLMFEIVYEMKGY